MSIIDRNGDHHGTDGTYQERARRDGAGFQLNPFASLADENAAWLEQNGLYLNSEGIQLMTEELDGWPVNAIVRVEAFKKAFLATNGYSYEQGQQAGAAAAYLDLAGRANMAAAIRAVMGHPITGERDGHATPRHATAPSASHDGWQNSNGDGSLETPAPYNDPRVQAGEVLDTIRDEDGLTTWHRRRDFIKPDAPNGIRIQATEPLSEADAEHLRDLIAYEWAASVHHGTVEPEVRLDSPYSFIVNIAQESHVAGNMGRFETDLPQTIETGSQLRSTDRMGPGTAGTRAVPPFPRAIQFEVYYDQVAAGVNLKDGDIFDEAKIDQMQGRLVSLGYIEPTIPDLSAMMSGR
jgi:hypothetical protein